MAQGDIYTIDVNLVNSSQIVSIIKDSIILSAIVSSEIRADDTSSKDAELKLLNSNGATMHRFFHRSSTGSLGWESIELPIMKKLKLNAGDQLQFKAYSSSPNYTYLNATITLMEV